MSKISERLAKLGQTETTGFGFGVSTLTRKIPVILTVLTIHKQKDIKDVPADALIMADGSKDALQPKTLRDTDIWGVSVSDGIDSDIDALVESGADFLVIETESTPGSALCGDDTGKGFVVDWNLPKKRARAIDNGPFDFLILDGSSIVLPLNVGGVLELQEQIAYYSRHIFLRLTQLPTDQDLELLRDIGISGLLYDVSDAHTTEFAKLRESIDRLEPRKDKRSSPAVLPSSESSLGESDVTEHEEEDWD